MTRIFGKQALLDRLTETELENARLRDLLRDLIDTYRLTNRHDEALLLVPDDLWLDIRLAAGVDPETIPGGGPDSASGELARGPAAAGDAPPEEKSA
jgi:hypothetical protein